MQLINTIRLKKNRVLSTSFKKIATLFTLLFLFCSASTSQDKPNILLVISDDLGVDFSNGYHTAANMPTTPTLDGLRENGITFENAFASPVCSPTRATIMSGKYGIKTGVQSVPGVLQLSHESIFKAIENETGGMYADAVLGKWHLAQGNDVDHPHDHSVDHFSGPIGGGVPDYYEWPKVENGESSTSTEYITTDLANEAIEWINDQNSPWFVWLANVAPHSPIHVPPADLFTINNTENNRRQYIAMIEAMDHELGRILDNIPTDELENTLIIYIGDNGTPGSVLRDYPTGHGKGSVYQGGVRVPFIVSGAGVSRKGEREAAMVHVTDIYATILEVVGAELPGGIYNSLSFQHLLDGTDGAVRDYNYSEVARNDSLVYAIRDKRYKLIEFVEEGRQEFYDLLLDSLETNDLIGNITSGEVSAIKEDLEIEARQIQTAWSCRDHIQNGDEEGIDCGGTHCAPCISAISELENKNSCFEIFPNPVEDHLRINSQIEGSQTLFVKDVSGNLLLSHDFKGNETSLKLAELNPGLYLLELRITGSDEICISKFIKH